MLKPIHVDPEDRSWKARVTRFRNGALAGATVEIHDVSVMATPLSTTV